MPRLEQLDRLASLSLPGPWEFIHIPTPEMNEYLPDVDGTYEVRPRDGGEKSFFMNDARYYPRAPDANTAHFLTELNNSWQTIREVIVSADELTAHLLKTGVYPEPTLRGALDRCFRAVQTFRKTS